VSFFKDKVILVTGGAGSIGSEIVRKLLNLNPSKIRVLDINETGLFELDQELDSDIIRLLVGDIRDKDRLKRAFEGVDIIFHAAALKHVPLCEYNPVDTVKTNVMGTQNVLDAATDEEVDKCIVISTDKAVNPVNVMGATKMLSEKLTISADFYKGDRKTIFSCVRFGNVLGSRGSVVPVFAKQIKDNRQITITDPEMTRFVMPISKAVELVLKSAEMSKGAEVFVLKMPVTRVIDIADVMVNELHGKNADFEVIGKRAGEKFFEELVTEDEAEITYENEEMYIIYPHPDIFHLEELMYDIPAGFKKSRKERYSSDKINLMTKDELRDLLISYNVI